MSELISLRDEIRARWPALVLATDDAAWSDFTAVPRDSAHELDLALAWSCLRGDSAALVAFERDVFTPVAAALRRQLANDATIDEVIQRTRTHLLVGDEPRLAAYAGRSRLVTWVRVVAGRLALNLVQREQRPLASLDEALAELPVTHDVDVELVRARFRGPFKAAIGEAITGLSAHERSLLRLHFIDGVTLPALAELYAVDRATVVRRLRSARRQIYDRARTTLGEALSLSTDEFDDIVHALDSVLSVSFDRLLG